jgi:NitT/TauT family transport system ATP-binding protein
VRPEVTDFLTFRDVTKVFEDGSGRGIEVVEPLTLSIGKGEFVVFVGPSGCGKTTVMRMAGGLETPSSGTIALNGRPVIAPSREKGMVFQSYSSFPWLTVAENVLFGMRYRKDLTEQQKLARRDNYLELVGLYEFSDAYPNKVSGGMRQRVAIARAFAQEADLLLMDEPFGALDAMTRDLLHAELERLWADRNLSVVFVTHNVREAARLADRVVLLSSRPGRVVAEFDVDIERPRRMDSPEVSGLAAQITEQLREEVRRHAHI